MVFTQHELPVGGTHSDTLRSQPLNTVEKFLASTLSSSTELSWSLLSCEPKGSATFHFAKILVKLNCFPVPKLFFFGLVWFGLKGVHVKYAITNWCTKGRYTTKDLCIIRSLCGLDLVHVLTHLCDFRTPSWEMMVIPTRCLFLFLGHQRS